MTDRDKLLDLVENIRRLIEENMSADGNCCFDALRAIIALDFAKAEVEKMVSDQIPGTD